MKYFAELLKIDLLITLVLHGNEFDWLALFVDKNSKTIVNWSEAKILTQLNVLAARRAKQKPACEQIDPHARFKSQKILVLFKTQSVCHLPSWCLQFALQKDLTSHLRG